MTRTDSGSPSVLVDASNLVVGGGVQVVASLLRKRKTQSGSK